MSDNSLNLGNDKHVDLMRSIAETIKEAAEDEIVENENMSDAIVGLMQDELADESSASGLMVKTQKLQKKDEVKIEKNKEAPESRLVRKEDADQSADQFSRREGNKQYHLDPLLLSELALEELGLGINENSNPEEIVEIIRKRMSGKGKVINPGMIDKGLEFLLEITKQQQSHPDVDEATRKRLDLIFNCIENARVKFVEKNKDEIRVCSNIIGAVDAVVGKTIDNVHDKLKNYCDMVHKPPEVIEVWHQFLKEGKGYREIVIEFKALSSYIGVNVKKKGLENSELGQLGKAARKMQAVLGVLKAGKEQSSHFLAGYLNNNHLLASESNRRLLPTHLNFEVLTNLFFNLTEERYPSADKINEKAAKIIDAMPLLDEYEILHLKIASVSCMRNMVKEVAPNHLFRSIQHRDELHSGIIEALEELEDQLEEMQEKMMTEEAAEEEN